MFAVNLRARISSQESSLQKHSVDPQVLIHDSDAAQCIKVITVLSVPSYLARNFPRALDKLFTLPALPLQVLSSIAQKTFLFKHLMPHLCLEVFKARLGRTMRNLI